MCPVVLRTRNRKKEILAFRHPVAGFQLVKGTIEPGELPDTAAIRELWEESGIRASGTTELGTHPIGKVRVVWHFFVMDTKELPETWQFRTLDDNGHVFAFFWHELSTEPGEEWHEDYRQAMDWIRVCLNR